MCISTITHSQDTIGIYYHIDNIKTGQSFTTKLIFMSDSIIKYIYYGDMTYDYAEGTYFQTDNLIKIKYTTLDYNIVNLKKDKIINTQPPLTIQVDDKNKFTNYNAYRWPIEIIMKKNKLIVIKTREDTDKKIKMRFKKLIAKQ